MPSASRVRVSRIKPPYFSKKRLIRARRAAWPTGRQHGASAGSGATADVVSTASWADLAGACRVSRARRTSRPLVRPRSAYCRTRATGGSPVARQAAGSLRTHSPAGRLTRPGSSPAVLQQAAGPEPRPSPTSTLTATVSSLTRFASRSATAAADEGNPWVAPRWPELMMAAGPAAGRGVNSPNPKQVGSARAVSSRGGSTTAVGRSRPRRAEG